MLGVVPAGLLAAAQRIADQAAALGVPHRPPAGHPERSDAAAAELSGAVDGYRGGFSRRLATVSQSLIELAGHYGACEAGAAARLAGVDPPA